MSCLANYPTKYLRLLALLVLVCLATALVRWTPFYRSPPPPSPLNRPTRSHEPAQSNLNSDSERPAPHIHGRWETVRASLGLPPLPHRVTPRQSPPPGRSDKRASRFDLARKRRAEKVARRLPPLYFAHDAPHTLDPVNQEQALPPTPSPLHDTRESSPSAG